MSRSSFASIASLLISCALFTPFADAQKATQIPNYGEVEDTVAFAKGLMEWGYHDLAKEVVKYAQETGAGGNGAQSAFDYLSAEISSDEGRRSGDPAKRAAALKDAVKAFEQFIAKHPSAPEVPSAHLQISELSRQAGEAVIAQIAKEKDTTKHAALREEAVGFFKKALAEAESRVKDLDGIKDRTDEQSAEYMIMRFSVARLHYSQALVFEDRTGVQAKLELTEARSILEDMEVDESMMPIALIYESRDLLAKLLVEDGKLPEAESRLKTSCGEMFDGVKNDANVVNDAVSRDTITGCYLSYSNFLTKTKNPPAWAEARKLLEELQKMMPEQVFHSRDGRLAMINLCYALQADGQMGKAKELAKKVRDADPTSGAAALATAFLEGSGGGAGGDVADDAGLLQVLIGQRERKDIPGAAKTYSRIMSRAATSKVEDVAEATFQMATLYFEKGFYFEAAILFNAVAEDYSNLPRASESKYNEALSYSYAGRVDKAKYWTDKSKEARADLQKRWPDSAQAKDMTFVLAEDAKAERKYPEAADLYSKVPTTSPKYGEGQYKAGEMFELLGEEAGNRNLAAEQAKHFARAQECYAAGVAALNKSALETLDKSEAKNLKSTAFTAQLKIVSLLLRPEIKQPEKASKLMDEIEAVYKDDKDKVAKLWNLRIRAYTLQGRGEEAASILESKLSEIKDLGDVAKLTLNVAGAVDADALTKADKDPNNPEALKAWKTALRLYEKSVDAAKKGGGANAKYALVGTRLLKISSKISGLSDDLSLFTIDPLAQVAEKANIERALTAYQLGKDGGAELDLDQLRGSARCAALLGKWDDAVGILQEFQKKYQLFGSDGRFNADLVKQNPRLPEIYQDLAVAYMRAGKNQKAYFQQALDISDNLLRNAPKNGKTFWECLYLKLATYYAEQNYTALDSELDILERNAPDVDGGKFGIKAKMDELRKFRNKSIVNK